MNKTNKCIIFKSDHSHFEITSQENAKAMLSVGNGDGLNRICLWLPENMIATMRQGKSKTKLELIWPNGDSLLRESGRVEAKAVARELAQLGVKVMNFKKGGGMVELFRDEEAESIAYVHNLIGAK